MNGLHAKAPPFPPFPFPLSPISNVSLVVVECRSSLLQELDLFREHDFLGVDYVSCFEYPIRVMIICLPNILSWSPVPGTTYIGEIWK